MNLTTPWTPTALLGLLAILIYLARRLRQTWLAWLAGLGLGAVGASLILLRLSSTSAPFGFPWPSALGVPPRWAADPEQFPFAIVIFLLSLGAAVARKTSVEKLVAPLLLTGATFLFLFAANLPALALSWLVLEVLLLCLKSEPTQDASRPRSTRALDGMWGFVAFACILLAWQQTGGATLRAYGAEQWSPLARTLVLAAAFVRMGVYPLVSRRVVFREARLEPLDAFAVLPVLAGLALAQRLDLLGPPLYPRQIAWAGALSALVCGFGAWHSASAHRRIQWALRGALALVLLLWGTGAVSPRLLFPSAAASIGLGFGLWMLRPPEPSPTGGVRQRIWWFIVWGGPAVALGLGPLSPLAYGMLQLWQHLLESSLLPLLLLGLAGQTLLIAALLRRVPLGETVGVHEPQGWSMVGLWTFAAFVLAVWPQAIAHLADFSWQETISGLHLSPSPGIWAAMILPLLGGIALPGPSVLDGNWRAWANRAAAILALEWTHDAVGAVAGSVEWALQRLEGILSETGYLSWAIAFLLVLILMLAP